MSNNYRWRFALSLIMLGSTLGAYAQKPAKDPRSNAAYKQVQLQGDQTRRMSEVNQVFREQLRTRSHDELRVSGAITDKLGFEHTRYQQFYKGIKVEFGTYIVHAKDGMIRSMNGDYKHIEDINITPSLSKDAALSRATAHVGASRYLWQEREEASLINYTKPEGELVILNGRLAYKFDIYALKPLSRDHIYVDASSGEVLFKNAIIHHADAVGTAATRYSGNKSIRTDSFSGGYRLRDVTRGQGIETYDMNMGINYNNAVDFVDNDNNWTSSEWNNAEKDNAAFDAHWAAEMTYDYFKTKFNRNSFDGNGAKIKSYVHFDLVEYGYPNNDNAFWDGSRMTYGDGTSIDPLTTIDIGAHEIGHAVCSYSANLVYSYESGAMNEGFSDIWAACVENFAAPEKNTWVLGEDLGVTVRSLENPKVAGQPDTYKGTNWYSGSADNGGVHTNSGVLNHWFYILSVGKSGTNDKGSSYNVTGIGIGKAAAIAYRLETVYLSANSQYADARQYGIKAAEDLYGAGSAEAIATQNAWYAVGIGSKYEETTCATGSVKLTLKFDNYPEETSWTLKNAGGATVASGGNYGSQPKGSTITQTFDLAAGNYTFTINDSYGDGICCSYGNGSYSLTANTSGTVLASGSSFTSSESKGFCIEGGSSGDTQAPSTPASLSASNVATTSASLSWSTSTDNVAVTGYEVLLGGSVVATVTGTSYNLTGLSPATAYTAGVRAKDAAGNTSAVRSTSFTTASVAVTYCATKGNNVNYEWIDLVQLGSINNTTGKNGGYGNFTNLSTNLTRGGSQTIYFSAGFASTAYTEYWRVWIDFNKDGDFTDAGEQVVSGSSSNSGTLSGTINVPATAALGQTRMRVSMKYNGAPTACETFSYGEVEDYTVNITNSFMLNNAVATDRNATLLGEEAPIQYFVATPNPAEDMVEIAIADQARGYSLKMMTLNGVVVREIESADAKARINIADLPQGIYIISMKTPREVLNTKIIKK